MGTWDSGNFDDDTAADHLGIVTDKLVAELTKMMKKPKDLGPDEYFGVAVPCQIELLNVICRQKWVGVTLPEPELISEWKTKYMAVWDACIDDLEPKPAYKKARRKVLVATFNELVRHSRREDG